MNVWGGLGFLCVLAIIYGLRACARANYTDWGHTWLNYLDGLSRILCQKYHHLRYTALSLPKTGAAIVVANHVSGLDPFLLVAATRRPLRFLIAKEIYDIKFVNFLFRALGCIPVDRTGRPENALRAAMRALQMGEVIALFPQGGIVTPSELPHKLKRGSLWLAHQTQTPVYPVYISGVKGVGEVIQGIIQRSEARLVTYPCRNYNMDAESLEELQRILEGLVATEPPSLP